MPFAASYEIVPWNTEKVIARSGKKKYGPTAQLITEFQTTFPFEEIISGNRFLPYFSPSAFNDPIMSLE